MDVGRVVTKIMNSVTGTIDLDVSDTIEILPTIFFGPNSGLSSSRGDSYALCTSAYAARLKGWQNTHASTLVYLGTKRGVDRFKLAWFQGSKEGLDDVAIWGADTYDNIVIECEKFFKIKQVAHWNPVLFLDQREKLHIFFKVGERIDDWETYRSLYDFENNTWSKPRRLVFFGKGGRGPVRSKPIILSDGSWLAPASIERMMGYLKGIYNGRLYSTKSLSVWTAFVDRSENMGRNWQKSDLIDFDRAEYGESYSQCPELIGGVIQPSLWESRPGCVHMLLRSTANAIFRSDSTDGGRNWTQAEKTGIPNNNSAVDVAQNDSGILCMAYNPVGKNWGARTPLSISFSSGCGTYWTQPVSLVMGQGSFSYPFVVPTQDGFSLTYTHNRIAIGLISIKCGEKLERSFRNNQKMSENTLYKDRF